MGSGAFAASGDVEHDDVGSLAAQIEFVIGEDVLDDEDGGAGLGSGPDGAQDGGRFGVGPVVQDFEQKVCVGVRQGVVEEVGGDRGDAVVWRDGWR